jgi:hypothetical protein
MATFQGWREANQLNNGREINTRSERMQLKKNTSLPGIAITANPELAQVSGCCPPRTADMTRPPGKRGKMTKASGFLIGNLL